MTTERASFYSRDPNHVIRDKLDPQKKKFVGIERRKEERRKAQDRRVDVRFDLDKEDRRQSSGRREEDKSSKFW